ncbi:SDR family NAD(P)-dependent oxidoreductase [Acrocarpospora pleiomorpha]|uniref:SDR family NAD(P)-dependent oxidoreductase n=1 Tax=Acrocarpospora pleiomorpha TaxID=90975 RepID=UPI001C3FB048|nr:SDR family oxidoreductase [Acrocarpospora pleiomorpha]
MTGGARGIGRAIVAALSDRGVDVVFTSRQPLKEQPEMAAEPYDLLDGDAEELIDRCVRRLGGLDTVILNAGEWAGGRIEKLPPQDWWRVVETNLRGNHLLARAALPALRASGAGSLLLVSSVIGQAGFPGDTAYASAKSAMTGFARALAKENGRESGVRVNVLAPGFVDTDMTTGLGERARQRIVDRTVLGRFGTAEEIAKAAVFLAEDATFCTGAVLTVDGGWTL